jgi:hypothetical protein
VGPCTSRPLGGVSEWVYAHGTGISCEFGTAQDSVLFHVSSTHACRYRAKMIDTGMVGVPRMTPCFTRSNVGSVCVCRCRMVATQGRYVHDDIYQALSD